MDSISESPFHEVYNLLFNKTRNHCNNNNDNELVVINKCELPVIDLSRLREEREGVERAMINEGDDGALIEEWVELANECVCCVVKHSLVQNWSHV